MTCSKFQGFSNRILKLQKKLKGGYKSADEQDGSDQNFERRKWENGGLYQGKYHFDVASCK